MTGGSVYIYMTGGSVYMNIYLGRILNGHDMQQVAFLCVSSSLVAGVFCCSGIQCVVRVVQCDVRVVQCAVRVVQCDGPARCYITRSE